MSAPKTILDHYNSSADTYEGTAGGCTRELGEHIIRLARDIKPITPDSKILDNACGTGIVADLLLRSGPHSPGPRPEIHAVDGAENMARIAASRFPPDSNAHAATMPGEALAFPDGTFSHSLTNVGLMFFADPAKGASEIWRTLQPGGVAVVTGWMALRHAEVVKVVQARVRPEDAPPKVPLSQAWLDPQHTVDILTEAGFQNLQTSEIEVHWGASTTEDVADLLMKTMGTHAFAKWSDDEKKKAGEVLLDVVREQAVPFSRGDGEGVGIQLRGTVFIGRKDW